MRLVPTLLLATALAAPAAAQDDVLARVTGDIVDAAGANIGSITVFDTPAGIVRVNVQATGIAPGPHGIHLHETGLCEGDFTSAGGHIAGDAMHGLVRGGPHPGDMPNAIVETDGVLSVEVFNAILDVRRDLMDGDGAAFIIHSGPDDYESQPSGDAGSRVACAVLNQMPE